MPYPTPPDHVLVDTHETMCTSVELGQILYYLDGVKEKPASLTLMIRELGNDYMTGHTYKASKEAVFAFIEKRFSKHLANRNIKTYEDLRSRALDYCQQYY